MPIIQFQKEHGGAAFIAPEGVIAESMEDGRTPFIKAAQDMMFFTGNCPKQFFVDISVPGINTAITYHFEMFFRDMPDQTLDEFKGRNRFCHILIIFMPVVMESDVMAAKRNKFHLSAVRAAIHGSTEGWIATIDHLVHVFDYGSTWMEDINHFFVMVCKDFLKDIHMNIIEEMDGKKKPHPSRLRGRGVEVSKTLCSR